MFAPEFPIVQSLLDAMAIAWSAADAVAFSALFTANAVLKHRLGTATSREEVHDSHAYAFRSTYRSTTLENCAVVTASRVGADIVATATRTIARGASKTEYDVNLTAREEDGEWRVARFEAKRKAEAPPLTPAVATAPAAPSSSRSLPAAAAVLGLVALVAALALNWSRRLK